MGALCVDPAEGCKPGMLHTVTKGLWKQRWLVSASGLLCCPVGGEPTWKLGWYPRMMTLLPKYDSDTAVVQSFLCPPAMAIPMSPMQLHFQGHFISNIFTSWYFAHFFPHSKSIEYFPFTSLKPRPFFFLVEDTLTGTLGMLWMRTASQQPEQGKLDER